MENTTTGGLPLKVGMLQAPPTHIPDGKGGAFKTELVLHRSEESTEKILWWYADDPREEPHNHPWDFRSEILSGGYTEDRYLVDLLGNVQKFTNKYRADGSEDGNVNSISSDVFHVVYDVLPNTTTHLYCGKASERNTWGYLNVETGEYTAATKDPDFLTQFRAINPHLRAKD